MIGFFIFCCGKALYAQTATIATRQEDAQIREAAEQKALNYTNFKPRMDECVFRNKKNAEVIPMGEGTWGAITLDPDAIRAAMAEQKNFGKDTGKITMKKEKAIVTLLQQTKQRLLRDKVLDENDLVCTIRLMYGGFNAAVLTRTNANKGVPQLDLDWRTFRNEDFLYITLKSVFMQDRIKRWFPEEDPAIRLLYALTYVNMQELLRIATLESEKAKKIIQDYNTDAAASRGIFSRYTVAVENSFLNARDFIPSLVQMLISEDEKIDFPVIRQRLRVLISDRNQQASYELIQLLYARTDDLRNKVREKRLALQPPHIPKEEIKAEKQIPEKRKPAEKKTIPEELKQLFPDDDSAPKVLNAFKAYAPFVEYRIIAGRYAFIRIRIPQENEDQYVHLCLGINDTLTDVLGKRGHCMGMTLVQWKRAQPNAFAYKNSSPEATRRDRDIFYGYITRQSLTKMIALIAMEDERIEKICTKHIKTICNEVYGDEAISKRTWNQLMKTIMKKKLLAKNEQVRKLYNLINNTFIPSYINRQYPKLLAGKYDLYGMEIMTAPLWPLVSDKNITANESISWMIPGNDTGPTHKYLNAYRVSIQQVFDYLDRRSVEAEREELAAA